MGIVNDTGPRVCRGPLHPEGVLLPGDADHFHVVRKPTGRRYLVGVCKRCRRRQIAEARARREARLGTETVRAARRATDKQRARAKPSADPDTVARRAAVQQRKNDWDRFRKGGGVPWCEWCCLAPTKRWIRRKGKKRRVFAYPKRCPRCKTGLADSTRRMRESVTILRRRGWTMAPRRPLWLVQYEWLTQHDTPPKGWPGPPLGTTVRTRAEAARKRALRGVAFPARCWAHAEEARPHDPDAACLRPRGHAGPHRWTPSVRVFDETAPSRRFA